MLNVILKIANHTLNVYAILIKIRRRKRMSLLLI